MKQPLISNLYVICFILTFVFITNLILNLYIKKYIRPGNSPHLRIHLKLFSNKSSRSIKGASLPPDITKIIIENTRLIIKNDLSNYNFNASGVKDLNDLLLGSGGHPIRSVILSTWRTGSTFLGEVLNAVPGNFYHYEPLLKFGNKKLMKPLSDEAVETIRNMLKCNFYNLKSYFKYGMRRLYQFSHNIRLWEQCRRIKGLCGDAGFTSEFCKLFPFQSMKTVRLRLRFARVLLDDETLNLKLVLLVRDPRGVMLSRRHRDFCRKAPDCSDPAVLCSDMVSDYVAASEILRQYPNRLMVLRFEELALDPNTKTRQLFNFLRLNVTESVDNYLKLHTIIDFNIQGYKEDISTFKVSQNVPFKWKNQLDFAHVDNIQRACETAMHLWGYKKAHNETHMRSNDFYPLGEAKILQ